MTPPYVWGPKYWDFLRMMLETCSDEQAKTLLVPTIHNFHKMLPCPVCVTHFTDVLAKFPPERYVTGAGDEGRVARLRWYDLVREEVRKNEAPKSLLSQLRKHRVAILRAVGFVVFLLIAGVVGALVLRRCQETGVTS
jgi:carbon starvation protein CstA